MISGHAICNKVQFTAQGLPRSVLCVQPCPGVRVCCSPGVAAARRTRASAVCGLRQVVAAYAASEPSAGTRAVVAVTFRSRAPLQFGQVLKVVGGPPSLGAWDADKAPAMEWGEGDQWTLTLPLPPGTHEFKLAVARGGGQPPDWEGGPNRALEVPAAAGTPPGGLLATCEWGTPHVALEPAAAEPRAQASLPGGGTGRREAAGVVGKPAREGAAAPQAAPRASHAPAKGTAAAAASSTPAQVPEREAKQAGPAGSVNGGTETPAHGGTAAPSPSPSPPPAAPPSAGPGDAADGPSPAVQAAVAAAGLAALPVVAWSEWVLRGTGCGLPPGPGGLLGAAEGLSYLVVGGVAFWSLARRLRTGSGLPAGPANLLAAVQGGSWLVVASGLAVLALQWQSYGYIPSALPDSNCFGQPASSRGLTLAALPGSSPAAAAAQRAAPPPADASQPPPSYGGALRVGGNDGRSLSVPQGNLLFSLEAALSQTGAVVEAAETAAAAVAAAAAGQPPPAQVSAALHHLQARAEAAVQLASALGERAVALAARGGTPEAAAAAAPAQQAPPGPEPLRFEPPRHRVRAALVSGLTAVAQSEQVRAIFEPVPLPAVARQAAAAAGGALEAVEQAAGSTLQAVEREEELAAAAGRRALRSAALTARQAGGRLVAALPEELRQWAGQEAAPQPAAAPAAAPKPAPKAATPPKPATSQPSPPGSPRPRPATAANGGGAAPAAARAGGAAPPAARAAAAAPQPASTNLLGTAVSDLREGFVGLYHSAKAFDPAQAAALLQERMREQAPPPPAQPAKVAPAAARAPPKNE